MNSFKASNDLKYNAIDDITQGDGAGDKGSAMKMKDDMAPKMEKGSAAYLHDEFTQKNNIKHK
tara:strand:- start:347 stop:535 length:189 start_codon:yes stop_codon:yes gene_type:complete